MLMFQPFRRYADFQGRARRAEYWQFALFVLLVEGLLVVTGKAMGAPGSSAETGATAVLGLFVLAVLVPSLAVGVRRLHDTNRSGWWLLISLIPLIGPIVIFVFTVLNGTHGSNRFGPDPKNPAGLTAETFA
jgi:uncharacterized membrane protein YhaH (DUF805 family)